GILTCCCVVECMATNRMDIKIRVMFAFPSSARLCAVAAVYDRRRSRKLLSAVIDRCYSGEPDIMHFLCKAPLRGLCTKNTLWALIERPYSCAPQAVGAVYDRPGFFVQSPLRGGECFQERSVDNMKMSCFLIVAAGLILLGTPGFAHHGTGVSYD